MKLIGHVSTAVLAATPLLLLRSHLPGELGLPTVDDGTLLWWTGLFAALPDIDILLARWTPLKHRGFASHSIATAVVLAIVVLAADATPALEAILPGVFSSLCAPLPAALAFLAVLVHLLGDSLTKTGVPLLYPGQKWHFPVIGGYAAFDNYFLNAIPLALAATVLQIQFHIGPTFLHGLGRWRDFLHGTPR